MRTTPEVSLMRINYIDRFPQTNLLLEGSKKHYATRTWQEHQFNQSCLRVHSSSQTDHLASAIVEVMVTPRIPSSYYMSACLAPLSEEEGKSHMRLHQGNKLFVEAPEYDVLTGNFTPGGT
ncbi:hypothetical protein AVEN_99156-1, partial [Araneus ventricosus]